MQLTGNTIFITGATSGIGRGLAEALHARGNKVIVSGRRKALLDEVTAANPGMEAIELDMTDPSSIAHAAAWLTRHHPSLNVLINNAGIMPFDDPAGVIDDATMQQTVATNLFGPIRMTSALMDLLKSQPSSYVIHNTSVVAFMPLAANAVYSATKAALHSYTQTQRFALRDTSVKVLEIAPPWVNTDLIYKSDDPRAMPLEAYVADTMAQLATDKQEIYVDAIQPLRDNPGSNEYALIATFNQALVDNPIPVG
ncbi:uncharacterized oxidoreductase [Luteibacter sp. UNCMF331Sha3.1]|uniref:SDR family oxidoreductase n=1 Tax=Luteibacter sp. UNCMF331Sha3.1 TaxID=1502760 RepID=UPI0008B6F8E5|nr:SDR family NAD(P)-dependent oxidoreductase [Luteibacter sp. UNCMF331Sha3.1]SEN05028.1 uncharacterized oxidoreductase [Luteibacter sp. UNCMF331Sha3.1]